MNVDTVEFQRQSDLHESLSHIGCLIALIRKRLGLSRNAFKDKIGVSEKTIENWESSGKISANNAIALEEILRTGLKEKDISVTSLLENYPSRVALYNRLREQLLPKWDSSISEDAFIDLSYPGGLIKIICKWQGTTTGSLSSEVEKKSKSLKKETTENWWIKNRVKSIKEEGAQYLIDILKIPEKLQKTFIQALSDDFQSRVDFYNNQLREWLLPLVKPNVPSFSESGELFAEHDNLVGQDALLLQIENAINGGKFVGVYGPSGIGKSAIMAEIGRRMEKKSRFPGGYVCVSQKEDVDIESVYLKVLKNFYTDEPGIEKLNKLFREEFRWTLADEFQWTVVDKVVDSSPFLLIIDDVASDEILTRIAKLFPETCSILFATNSQDVINKLKEVDRFTYFNTPLLSPDDAIKILKQQSKVELSDTIFRRLAFISGYSPKALSMVGTLLAKNKRIFSENLKEGGLTDIVKIPYEKLSEFYKNKFHQLGAFASAPAVFSQESLLAIWKVSKEDQQIICQELQVSNLIICKHERATLFAIDPLILEFAKKCLDSDPQKKRETILSHANYYQQLICGAKDLDSFYRERGQIKQARHNLLDLFGKEGIDESDEKTLLEFAESTTALTAIYPLGTIDTMDRVNLLARVTNITQKKPISLANKNSVNWFTIHLANAYLLLRNTEQAKHTYMAISQGWTQAEHHSKAHAAAFIGLGLCDAFEIKFQRARFDEEKFERAKKNLQEGEDIARPWYDDNLLFYAYCAIGDLYFRRLQYIEDWLKQVGHRRDQSETDKLIIDIAHFRYLAEKNYKIASELKLIDERLKTLVLRRLGDIYAAQGNTEKAIESYQKSRKHAEDNSFDLAVYYAYKNEAIVRRHRSNNEDQKQINLCEKAANDIHEKIFSKASFDC